MEHFILFLAGILAAMIGSSAGGGGAIVGFLALIFVGVPVPVAIGTQILADIGHCVLSIRNYNKAKKIDWNLSFKLVVIGIIGALIGSNILVSIDENLIKKIVVMFLFIVLIILLTKNNLGLKKEKSNKFWPLGYFFIAIYSSFIGIGGGIFAVIVLSYLKGLKFIESVANHKVGVFANSIVATIVFIYNDLVNYSFGASLFLGSILGGYIGSKITLKKGNVFVKYFIIALICLTILRLIFF